MKNLLLLGIFTLLIFGCGNQKKQEQNAVASNDQETAISVDDLYQKAPDLVDREIVVKGTVLHVCKEGGVRCFLMGSSDSITIRVEAGAGIGAFTQEQVGSDLEIVGILKEVKSEAEAHNPGQEHSENADTATTEVHQTLADNQATQEIVYYIDGMKVK